MNTIINKFAFAGYDYATSNGTVPSLNTELELMAFNAGISNANIRHNLNVEQIIIRSTSNYHDAKSMASHKELSTIWGNN